jgi:hypothetical protein
MIFIALDLSNQFDIPYLSCLLEVLEIKPVHSVVTQLVYIVNITLYICAFINTIKKKLEFKLALKLPAHIRTRICHLQVWTPGAKSWSSTSEFLLAEKYTSTLFVNTNIEFKSGLFTFKTHALKRFFTYDTLGIWSILGYSLKQFMNTSTGWAPQIEFLNRFPTLMIYIP